MYELRLYWSREVTSRSVKDHIGLIKLLGGLHIKDHDRDDVVGHVDHGRVWAEQVTMLAVAVRELRRGGDDVTGYSAAPR